MSLLSLIILAIGLCMDSFAVSLSSGVLMRPFTWQRVGKFSLFMALFQGAMPVIGTVICLALATSIDALAVGISLSFLRVDMLLSASVIALTTLLFSVGGLFIGRYIGSRLQKYAEIMGGVILIAIGIKICIEHLFFA